MQLPVDVKAVVNAAMDIEGARNTPLSVSVLVDGTAPSDLIGHVRGAFASASAHARVTVEYLGESLARPHEGDTMAVLVAGFDERIGAHAAAVRAAGVPVMVVTTLPQLVEDMAAVSGEPIPEGDVVFPERLSRCPLAALCAMGEGTASAGGAFSGILADARNAGAKAVRTIGSGVSSVAQIVGIDTEKASAFAKSRFPAPADSAVCDEPDEPIVLEGSAVADLDRRMGEWIIDACADKRLAFALAFPFVRRPLSVESVYATSTQNAGVGLVAFLPGADMPIMTLNQAKMLLQIAAAYGEPLDRQRVKELIAVVGGAFACRSAARQLVAVVPAFGWAVKAGIGYAGTLAMGRAAIEYFEGGGNVAGVANVAAAACGKAVDAARAARTFARG